MEELRRLRVMEYVLFSSQWKGRGVVVVYDSFDLEEFAYSASYTVSGMGHGSSY